MKPLAMMEMMPSGTRTLMGRIGGESKKKELFLLNVVQSCPI
jgi:hypothetical protein